MPPTFMLTLISAAVAGAGGFALAWRLQSANMLEMQNETQQTRIMAQRVARQAIERATSAVITAQNNATARNRVLRADADAARGDLAGLQDATATAMRAASENLDACNTNANTFSQLLNQCGQRYTDVAAKADGHVSDLITCTEARSD